MYCKLVFTWYVHFDLSHKFGVCEQCGLRNKKIYHGKTVAYSAQRNQIFFVFRIRIASDSFDFSLYDLVQFFLAFLFLPSTISFHRIHTLFSSFNVALFYKSLFCVRVIFQTEHQMPSHPHGESTPLSLSVFRE